jgi:hypothetical protein
VIRENLVTAAGKTATAADGAAPASSAGPASSAAPAVLGAVRACYGAALLLAPGPLIRICTGYPADSRAQWTARVLGARHLTQAALTVGAGPGSQRRLGVSAAVDLVHASSMAGLAAASPRLRRTALTDALLETALAAAGLVLARA